MRRRGLATHKYSRRISFLATMEDAGGDSLEGGKMLLISMTREILWPSLEEGGCWRGAGMEG